MAMRILNYEDAKKAVLLTLQGSLYRVPMIMGDRGCGKTSMASEIAESMDANFITIDANVIKEGDISGLPTIYYENESGNNMRRALVAGLKRFFKEEESNDTGVIKGSIIKAIKTFAIRLDKIEEQDRDEKRKRTLVFAPHVKLQQCLDFYEDNPEKATVLFIDELNRCDTIVKRELMNLILNREINGLKLPDNVYVIAACNPSSNFEEYRDTDYQVEDMDEAQQSRFRWIAMKSELSTWIRWGMSINPDTNETYIHNDVIEYLMDREEFLNNIEKSKDDIKTSPRSWEFVSDTYRAFLKAKKTKGNTFTDNDFLNAIAGDISLNIASDFLGFLEDNKNPLIRPEAIFEGASYKAEELTDEVMDIISNESILRKNVLIHNCLSYIKRMYAKEKKAGNTDKKLSKSFTVKEALFIDVITKAINNTDLMYSLLLDLKISKYHEDNEYLKHILSLKDINIINAFTKLTQSF